MTAVGYSEGARVRVLKDNAGDAEVKKGDTGFIEHVDSRGNYVVVVMDDSREAWCFSPPSDIELIADKAPARSSGTSRAAFISRLQELYDENVKTAEKKNADYAQSEDPFHNFRMCKQYGVPVEKGFIVRMSDKMTRISNLLDKDPSVAEESVLDACMDLANYATLLCIWLEQNEDAAA